MDYLIKRELSSDKLEAIDGNPLPLAEEIATEKAHLDAIRKTSCHYVMKGERLEK